MKFYQLLLENTAINATQIAGDGGSDFESWFQEQVKKALIGYDAQKTAQVMNTLGNVINKFKKEMLSDILNDPSGFGPTVMSRDSNTDLLHRVNPTPKDGKYIYIGTSGKSIVRLERGIDVDVIDSNPKWKSALDKGYLFWVNVFNIKDNWVQDFIHDLIGIYKYAITPAKEMSTEYVIKIKGLKDPAAQRNAFAELKSAGQQYSKRVQQAAKNLIGALMQVKPGRDENHTFTEEMRGRVSWMIGELKDEHEKMFKEVLPAMTGDGLEKVFDAENGEVIWKITNKFASMKEGNALRNCIGTYYEFNDDAGVFTVGGGNIDADDYRNSYDIYVLKDVRGKTTTAVRMASHSDYPILFEIKGYNNNPPDPFHGKTIMNWLNSNDQLEVNESAKNDLIGGGIIKLDDGTWGTFLDKAKFKEIDSFSNGDKLTTITNIHEFDSNISRRMFANGTTSQTTNTKDFSTYEKLYQIRDPKGAIKWVFSVSNKVLEQFCKPGMGNNGFRHLSTDDVVNHTQQLKIFWPTFVEKNICQDVNNEIEEQMLAAYGHIIDGNAIIPLEQKWPHDLIKEVEGIKIFRVTAPTNKMYYDHRYHEMYQGDKGGDSYTDHDEALGGTPAKDNNKTYFLLVQADKILYAVNYDKREKTVVPTLTAQGTDTDSGLPLESGVIINPKIRKEITHAIAWLSKDHHGTEQHTDFPQDPDLIDTEEYWDHYGKNIQEVVSKLVSLGPKMTNLKMNRILGNPLNIVLHRWDQISKSLQDRLLKMFTTSDYQISSEFADRDSKGDPPKTHTGEGWIIIRNGIRFPHNKDTLETFHKTPLKALGTALGKQLAQQLISINKKLLTDKRYASFEINDNDEGDIDDVLRIVSQGDQSTVDIVSKLYAQLNSYYESIHEKVLKIESQVGYGTGKALKTIIPYMSRRKDVFPVGGIQKLLTQLAPGMPAEDRTIEMDVKTKWLTPTTFTLPNWDKEWYEEKLQEHAMISIDKYINDEEKKGWGGKSANEKKYISDIDFEKSIISIGSEPMMYYYNYQDDFDQKSQIEKEAKDGLELNAKMEVQSNPKHLEFVRNTDNFKMPYFKPNTDVDPYGHNNFTYEIKLFAKQAGKPERFWRDFVQPLDHALTKNIALCEGRIRRLKNAKVQSASDV